MEQLIFNAAVLATGFSAAWIMTLTFCAYLFEGGNQTTRLVLVLGGLTLTSSVAAYFHSSLGLWLMLLGWGTAAGFIFWEDEESESNPYNLSDEKVWEPWEFDPQD